MPSTEFLVAKNRAYSELDGAISSGATSLTVKAGEGANFPSTYPFNITIDDEIFKCTNRVTDVLTVVGAQESTSAAAHADGRQVSLNITAKVISDLTEAVNDIEKYVDYGLSFFGAVTTYTDTTHFKVSTLAGLGASVFLPASGTPYEILVFKADGAAPQGEQTPVVAYTTSDGTFQHAAFTTPLAVGDEVLIINPLLASLGTKAAAAASGAVTSTDYMMAYVKQLVTELIVVDTVVDGIQSDLDNATDGLGALKDLIDAIITDIASAVPEPPTAKSLQDILHKDTNYGFTKGTDALQAISDDIDHQHLNIHILFIIPEAVGSITADNIALRTEIEKLGDVLTITQGDALEFPAFGSYAIAVLGSNSGSAWTTSNLADLKNILGLTLLCVDKACAAYLEIGTDGGDASTKTIIKAISEIEGTKMGQGDENHQSVTGIDAGNNTVSSSATYHTLDMSAANITETVFCTEANDPDGGTAKEDVVLGMIRRIQNDGTIGVDEAGDDVPATLGFAGFAYEGDKLTTLGKALFLLFCHELIQLRIQESAVETGGLVVDLRKRIFGNMKSSFTNTAPMVEYIAGENSVGGKLPVGTSLADLIGDTGDAIPAMTATPGTLATLPLLKAILERIGVTPADPDDSIHTILGQRDATVSAGILADTESALALLRRVAQGSGLSILGDITGYTDVNNLVVADFIGWEDGYFIGWTAYLERDDGGAGAIPQGSRPVVTGYTSSTGALVLSDGLAAAGAEGDHLRLIHPVLADAKNLRGGVGGVADILENQAAEMDMAEVRTIASPVTLTAAFQYIYSDAPGRPFYFHGGFVSRASGTWSNSEAVTINVEVKIDGSNWVEIWTKSYIAEPTPALLAVPAEDPDDVLKNFPHGFPNNGDGVRVGIKQTVVGDGYHTWNHSFLDEVAGT